MMWSELLKALARWCIALIPLLVVIALTSNLSTRCLYALWHVTLSTTGLFYLACAVIPKTVRKLQSMPYTYILSNNLGPAGMHAQVLTYASYHTRWYNHITHTAFPFEALLWQLVVYSYFHLTFNSTIALIALISLNVLLILQALSFKEKLIIIVLMLWWTSLGSVTVLISSKLTPTLSYRWGVILLLSLGFWRFTGHCIEPIPPAIVNNKNFIPINKAGFNSKLLGAFLLGFTSEFAAGLPFRLINAWLYVGLQQRFPQTKLQFTWEKAKEIKKAVHVNGWNVHPRTKELIKDEPF